MKNAGLNIDQLSEALSRGEQEALASLFQVYYTPLVRYALSYLAEPAVAEELVQDLFITLWEKRKELSIKSESYLYTSIKNKSINYLKTSLYQRGEAMCDIDDLELEDRAQTSGMEELETLVEKALKQLPERTVAVFKLSRQAEMSHREIGELLSISSKGVEYHIGVALKVIRKVLSRHGYLMGLVSLFMAM